MKGLAYLFGIATVAVFAWSRYQNEADPLLPRGDEIEQRAKRLDDIVECRNLLEEIGRLPDPLPIARTELDIWGHPLKVTQLDAKGECWELRSAGTDGEFYTKDDVTHRITVRGK